MTDTKLFRAVKLYLSSAILYGAGILLFRNWSYYLKMLSPDTQNTLLYLYLGYLIIAPIIYLLFVKEYTENKPYLFFRAFGRNILALFSKNGTYGLEKEEKVALLFILVKLFFLPTMTNFFYGNFSGLLNQNGEIQWYPFILTLLFAIDTLIFSIGYIFESHKLKNIVKSVEPTFLGWFVAVICYPPFNSMVGSYVPWGANDHMLFWSPAWTMIMHVIMVFLLIIYVWATIALGLKSSNLTNRGIVTKFPYSIIRHPAYISKNLIWWVSMLPVMSLPFFLGMSFWSIIYFFRAWTEERHLGQDQDYVKYCEKVKWRFVPGVV